MIPYGHQTIDKKDIAEVVKVLKSDWLTQGPKILEFEKALARYGGAKYAVACSSGTAALHLAYLAAGLQKENEVIISSNTFAATANMVVACGAKPIFCDIRLDTYNIDETKIEKLITKKTKAIVPVHFAGRPCEMEKIHQIAKKHQLLVIEDACHALGARYKNSKIGGCQYSDMAAFSFHPVKSITIGEGGAVLTNSKKYYEAALKFRNHGITKNPSEMTKNDGPWYYEIETPGFNYRTTDLQCALGISQFKKIDKFISIRKKIASYYFEKLENIKGLILPDKSGLICSAWHLFVVRVKNRKEVFKKLRSAGIGVQAHYIPVYHQPYYQKIGYKNTKLKNTEEYYQTCISLPLYPGLKQKEQDYVIEKLKLFLNQ